MGNISIIRDTTSGQLQVTAAMVAEFHAWINPSGLFDWYTIHVTTHGELCELLRGRMDTHDGLRERIEDALAVAQSK